MDTKILKEFCKKAKKLHSKKNTLPVLDNVLIKNGTITFTNLEQTVILNNAQFYASEALIPLEFFKKIVEKTKEIDISEVENHYIIKIPGASYNVEKGSTPDDFPQLPGLKKPNWETINPADVKRIKKSNAYTMQDELRPKKEGVYVDTDNIVATDEHVLGFHQRQKEKGVKTGYENEGQNPVFIHYTIVDLLAEEPYHVRQDENNVYMEGTEYTFVFRQLDEKYYNWKSVIPEGVNSQVTLETNTFKKVLEQADLAANQASHLALIYNCPEKSLLNIRAKDIDFGYGYNCNLQVENSKESLLTRLNINMMLNVIKTEKYESMDLQFTGNGNPIIINGEILLMSSFLDSDEKENLLPSEEELKQEVIES